MYASSPPRTRICRPWSLKESFGKTFSNRVNVIELRVPSLRERREDVPELAEAILRRLGRRMKTTPPMLGKDALAAFESYDFPGNVRELENISRARGDLSTGGEISALDIQLRPTRGDNAPAAAGAQNGGAWGTIWKMSSATPF